MQLLKKIVWLCAICLLLTVRPSVADLPSTLEQIRPAVVGVGTVLPTRNPRAKFTGTGFAVADGRYVITNHHVIPDVIDYAKKETLTIFTGRGKEARGLKAELIGTDEWHDLALLKISGKPLPALKIDGRSAVKEGEQYAFTGFPIGMVLGLYPVTHKGMVSAITPIVIPAMSSQQLSVQQIRRMRAPFEVYQLDAIAYPGNSGSPLYDIETGRVVGVVNSVFVKESKESVLSKPSGIAYAIPSEYIKKLLDKYKITY